MAGKTVEQGLGKRHREEVKYLKQRHKDGSPCDWCGREMWLDATRNYDYNPSSPGRRGNGVLQGDHSVMSRSEALRRGVPVMPPDRLLHESCNRERGVGLNDHLSVANGGNAPVEKLRMPWPWG